MAHETKNHETETAARVHRVAKTAAVAGAVATLHTDTPAAVVVVRVFERVSNFETAHPRDIFYFAAGCVSAHYATRAQYSVLCRVAVAVS
jgi:hypothetical protein